MGYFMCISKRQSIPFLFVLKLKNSRSAEVTVEGESVVQFFNFSCCCAAADDEAEFLSCLLC